MTLLNLRRPNCIIEEEVVSYSGKYNCFLGHHFHENKPCWVVGTINNSNGEVVMRHYKDSSFIDPKANALACWVDFKEAMLAKPEDEESDNEPYKWITGHGNS